MVISNASNAIVSNFVASYRAILTLVAASVYISALYYGRDVSSNAVHYQPALDFRCKLHLLFRLVFYAVWKYRYFA